MGYVWSTPDAELTGPLHIETQGALREPGAVFACERPEAPTDDSTWFHDCCDRCLVAVCASRDRGDPLALEDGTPLAERMAQRLDQYGPAPRLSAVR